MTQQEMDKVIAQYRHWIDRPYEPDSPAPVRPSWSLSDAFGMVVALVMAGAGVAVIFS